MNNERAIELLHRLQDEQFDGEYGDERREALSMAVRAMSGHGDTISRKGVFIPDITVEMLRNASLEGVEDLMASGEMEDISLPPAQPERKKGKWITVNGRLGNEVECDNCHSVFWYWMGNYSFCPSCGARMEGESDES